MGKFQSLRQLDELGFNTPLLLYWTSPYVSPAKNLSLWKETNLPPGSTVSIRTERSTETNCPHYPNILLPEANKLIKKLIKEEYSVYVFQGIDPKDCIRRGNLVVKKNGHFIMEWLEGPGTVRDTETAKKLEHKEYHAVYDLLVSPLFKPLHSPVSLSLGILTDKILEWSIYNKPVGKLSREDIYWELRPWS